MTWRTSVASSYFCARPGAVPRPLAGRNLDTNDEPRLVPARGRLTETPVTGDWVELDDGDAIAAIKPRHGSIVRRDPGEATDGQVLAVNVDLALVTEPLPDPKARRLERFAALAASGGVPVAVVLTKTDLADDGYLTAAQMARRMGVADAIAVSALTGEGIGAVRQLLQPGATAVLLGASGTGKSTLINALLGEDRQATARSAPTAAAATPRSRASC